MPPERVHLVGIGGTGMSALARLLVESGYQVSGSDRKETPVLATLRGLGAEIWLGQRDDERMGRPDVVAISSAIRPGNPEVVAARRRGIPVLGRAAMLARAMAGKTTVAVAGTAGKTTTTGMVVAILEEAGLDPSFAIGGDFMSSGVNAGAGAGPHFVVEADESDGTFLEFRPTVAVVTNVEADHLDYYADLEAVCAAFRAFVALLPPEGTAVLCADDVGAGALAAGAPCPVLTYGLGAGAGLRAVDLDTSVTGSRFRVELAGEPVGRVGLVIPGRHNVANALAAIAATRALGVGFQDAAAALGRYTGMARRFELRAQRGGVTVVDDYAHHPTKVAATLVAARLGSWSRVVAVFQPHRYTRTRALATELGQALTSADVAVVTDVYSAGEDPEAGVDGTLVAAAAAAARSDLDLVYVPDRGELAKQVAALVRPGDLVLTLGAGDITNLADELAPLLPTVDREDSG
ncbi:MAG TPA: UDP-N-acetylmuramate--L-alanine ligase [Actinomycetes bacterium]|jgi:UDP-N-acetylmuramate--alanine ligase|nr:UDP-N-acetylmuramate--L-alanine ligase [Actinomycetes bacterium]